MRLRFEGWGGSAQKLANLAFFGELARLRTRCMLSRQRGQLAPTSGHFPAAFETGDGKDANLPDCQAFLRTTQLTARATGSTGHHKCRRLMQAAGWAVSPPSSRVDSKDCFQRFSIRPQTPGCSLALMLPIERRSTIPRQILKPATHRLELPPGGKGATVPRDRACPCDQKRQDDELRQSAHGRTRVFEALPPR